MRTFEDTCISIADLATDNLTWRIKVVVAEKTPKRIAPWGTAQQKFLFVDNYGTNIQCNVYKDDVNVLDEMLELYRTYYIGNGTLKYTKRNLANLTDHPIQITLTRSALIRKVATEHQIPLDNLYTIQAFTQLPELKLSNKINILGAVIHCFPPKTVSKGAKHLQEFVIVNDECIPTVLTLWDDFLPSEAVFLTENLHMFPIVLGIRLSISTYHGISVTTPPNCVLLFNPPIPETAQLRTWLDENTNYIETIIPQELYTNRNTVFQQAVPSEIRKIGQIQSMSNPPKSFSIKGKAEITKINQRFYSSTCPDCSNFCGADAGEPFKCLYCNHNFIAPNLLLHFQITLSDGTGLLDAIVENKNAESLLELSLEDIVSAQQEGSDSSININAINNKLQDRQVVFQLRSSSNTIGSTTYTKYTITNCHSLLTTSSSEASTSIPTKRKAPSLIPMIEDQPSDAASALSVPGTGQETTPPSPKRSIGSSSKQTKKLSKHAKED